PPAQTGPHRCHSPHEATAPSSHGPVAARRIAPPPSPSYRISASRSVSPPWWIAPQCSQDSHLFCPIQGNCVGNDRRRNQSARHKISCTKGLRIIVSVLPDHEISSAIHDV